MAKVCNRRATRQNQIASVVGANGVDAGKRCVGARAVSINRNTKLADNATHSFMRRHFFATAVLGD